jgi:hypothetical protein
MQQPIEVWLNETQLAMQNSIQKQMLDALTRFASEPFEQWVLDYP